jgi:hypothetical protein
VNRDRWEADPDRTRRRQPHEQKRTEPPQEKRARHERKIVEKKQVVYPHVLWFTEKVGGFVVGIMSDAPRALLDEYRPYIREAAV